MFEYVIIRTTCIDKRYEMQKMQSAILICDTYAFLRLKVTALESCEKSIQRWKKDNKSKSLTEVCSHHLIYNNFDNLSHVFIRPQVYN